MFFANQTETHRRGKADWLLLAFLALLGLTGTVRAAGSKSLPGHVPAALARLTAIGTLPATNRLNLVIGLPLRHPAELAAFLNRLYDPASPDYRQYLTQEQFTERYGPTAADYATVIGFARQHHLTISTTHGNRLVLDVNGAVPDIEQALNVSLKVYHHPTEARDFFATDVNPTVDAGLPIADVGGLNNFQRPRPMLNPRSAVEPRAVPRTGSGPSGNFIGNDFRTAYLPGVTLTGTGQTVGLVEFSGYYPYDIAAYESKAGIASVPLVNVSVDHYGGQPLDGEPNTEAALDIEMTVSMAPGLSKIVIFDAGTNALGSQNDILEAMVTNTAIRQFSCSWTWPGGPSYTTDNLFEQMIAQGQSFFTASGDGDAFTIGVTSTNGVDNPEDANAPASSPYVTAVGGTTLVTGAGGAWSSETVWNWGLTTDDYGNPSYAGSSGGTSTYYAIPSWQANVSMSANGGSSYFRNIPDVAANADNVYVTHDNGSSSTNIGGTSCAAPLWGALAALMNEQAANSGRPAIGFVNPVIYTLGRGASYTTAFHDITSGNNEWAGSPGSYVATTGYDLCTGWGAPAGQSLINTLAGFEPLTITQSNGFATTGYVGGPFNTNSEVFTLNNTGSSTFQWSTGNLPAWLTANPASGTLAAQSSTSLYIGLNTTAANALSAGNYPSTVSITDLTTGSGKSYAFSLQAGEALAIMTNNGFTASGQVGGPFNVTATNLILTNLGTATISWNLGAHPGWLTVVPTNGTISAKSGSVITASLNAAAKTVAGGVYPISLAFNDVKGQASATFPIVLQVGQSILQNGGFEAGTFTNWNLTGTPNTGSLTYNGVVSSSSQYSPAVHAGTYGAFLGDTVLATLSQNVATVPGQTYLLSFWLINPGNGAGQQFAVNWITNSATASRVYYVTNPPVLAWTNLTFVLPATGTNTQLQFGAENDPDYFGLDDVSLTPIPNPAIGTLTRSGGTLSLTLYTTIGVKYQLLYATNLAQTAWLPLSTNTAAATTLTITNSASAGHQGFYRIRQLP